VRAPLLPIALHINRSRRALSGTKVDIEHEVRGKVTAAKANGAYVFHSDHSIPSMVSLENYRYTLRLAQEYGRIR